MEYKLDPAYNSLDRIKKWDGTTQDEIKKRLNREIGHFDDVLKYNFLSEKEGEILEIITDILIPQENKKEYIKIAEAIDSQLSYKKQGVRYGKNPWKGDFYKKGLKEINDYIIKSHEKPIENMNFQELQNLISQILEKNDADFLQRFLKKILSDSIGIYFSHPASWNKIGFPGPAYPEGYAYLKCGEKDDWEPEYKSKS